MQKLNSQAFKASTDKVRALSGKDSDPTNRDGNLQEDQNEAQDTEPLNSGESSLQVEEVSQLPFRDTCFSISV